MSRMVFVKVIVDFDIHGKMTPLKITWPDGRQYDIDRVLDVRMSAAKSGGSGIRFLCRIQHREVPIYYNDDTKQWWCDGK